MTVTQLEYALAVYKHRHFGRAAEACHITQPTLSMQLQKLEDELGVILFDRSKNPIIPTQEGERVISQAQNVIQEYKKIYQVIDQGQKDLVGDFRLGVIPTLSPYLIPVFAATFCRKYPQVNLYIHEHKTEDILDLLEKDELDAGLLVTPLYQDNLIERTLFHEPFYLFVSADSPFSEKEMIKESELKSEGLWLLTEGHCMRNQMTKICSMKNHTQQGGNLHFESGNIETLMNMVIESSGYTLIPHLALKGLSPAKKKMVRSFQQPVPSREISLVHRRIFLKERHIDALEREILMNLPKDIISLKNSKHKIIDI